MSKKVKNKPKINKELSIIELKHLLEEAEKMINRNEKRIRILERVIIHYGGTIPEETDNDDESLRLNTESNRDDMETITDKFDDIDQVSSDGDSSDLEEEVSKYQIYILARLQPSLASGERKRPLST